jgi:hypothetical protein
MRAVDGRPGQLKDRFRELSRSFLREVVAGIRHAPVSAATDELCRRWVPSVAGKLRSASPSRVTVGTAIGAVFDVLVLGVTRRQAKPVAMEVDGH